MDRWSPRCALALAALWGWPAPAQEQPRRPDAAQRTVKAFDFEERQTNPGEAPRAWYREQDEPTGRRRPGYPPWNGASLVYDGSAAHSGEGFVRLPTRGGSTSLVLGQGAIPVFASADYRVSARVRTEGLTHAGACIEAWLTDNAGAEVPGTRVRSAVTRSPDAWAEVTLDVVGGRGGVAWMQVELLLLQPEQAARNPVPSPHRVWSQDFSGAACFDDVSISQLPQVRLRTNSPTGVVEHPGKPTLVMTIRDLAGERLDLRTTVTDVRGRVVARWAREMEGGTLNDEWAPELPGLGWYRADLRITSPAGPVGEGAVDFVWAPPLSGGVSGPDARQFGLEFLRMPAWLDGVAPRLANDAGVGLVTVPAWSADLTPQEAPARAKGLGEAVGKMITAWREVVVSLPELPGAASPKAVDDPGDAWPVLLGGSEGWTPLAIPFADELGSRVAQWQVGPTGEDRLAPRSDLSAEARAMRDALGRLMATPVLVLPGRLDRALPSAAGVPVVISAMVPATMEDGAVREAVSAHASSAGADAPPLRAVFAVPADQPPDAAACGALARRVVEYWAGLGEASRVRTEAAIASPWVLHEGAHPAVHPRPELGVWRTLVEHLRGRRVVGELPRGEGVRCLILSGGAGESGGALVAWRQGTGGRATLDAYLGEGRIEAVDLFGNVTPAPPSPREAGRRAESSVALSDWPVFIEGVDVNLMRLLAGVRFEPGFLESDNQDRECAIVLTNPWSVPLSGRVTIVEPGGFDSGTRDRSWRISPRGQDFVIPPGREWRLPVAVGFSPVEEAGPRDVVLRLNLAASRSYEDVEVRRVIEVGSRLFSLALSARVEGGEAVIDARVTNTSDAPLQGLGLTAFAPDQPRGKSAIVELPAGSDATRTFRFKAEGLSGQRVLVRVTDPESDTSISRSVLLP